MFDKVKLSHMMLGMAGNPAHVWLDIIFNIHRVSYDKSCHKLRGICVFIFNTPSFFSIWLNTHTDFKRKVSFLNVYTFKQIFKDLEGRLQRLGKCLRNFYFQFKCSNLHLLSPRVLSFALGGLMHSSQCCILNVARNPSYVRNLSIAQ